MSLFGQSKQWWIWMGIAVTSFVICAEIAKALGLAPQWGFAFGVLYTIPLQYLAEVLADWQQAQERVKEVSPDA